MKTILHTFILLIIQTYCTCLFSQDFHFSGFPNNQIHFNPACAGMNEMPEVSLTYRNQWPGIDANFVTYAASYLQPLPEIKSGIGISMFHDSEAGGVYSRTSANLIYGYSFKVSRKLDAFTGLQASYVIRQFDPGNLVFASTGGTFTSVPPYDISGQKKGYPDFSIGIAGEYYKKFRLGGSVSHVTRPKESFSSDSYDRLPVKYTVYAGYRYATGGQYNQRAIRIIPAVWYIHQGVTDELVWGSSFKYHILYVGVWLRQNFHFNFSSLIISAGISHKKYTFLYSYDVNLTGVNFLSTKMGSHEVTFLYRFKYKRENLGAVNYPDW